MRNDLSCKNYDLENKCILEQFVSLGSGEWKPKVLKDIDCLLKT